MSHDRINQFIALSRKYFKTYLGISIAVFLFILFFQPFPSIKFEFDNKLLFIAGYGFIIFIIEVIIQIVFQHYLLRNILNESYNPLLHLSYYFLQAVLISVAFAFYTRYVGNTNVTFTIMVRIALVSLSVPLTLYLKATLALMHDKHKKLLDENRLMHDKLQQFSESYADKFIELSSDNEQDTINVKVSEIVFIKSADNYVEIGFVEGDDIRKKMIRNTLKNIEKQLKEFNNFVRTHRSSIVNIQYIDKLNKNFNTYWLTLANSQETIPVSRQYLMAVKDLL